MCPFLALQSLNDLSSDVQQATLVRNKDKREGRPVGDKEQGRREQVTNKDSNGQGRMAKMASYTRGRGTNKKAKGFTGAWNYSYCVQIA